MIHIKQHELVPHFSFLSIGYLTWKALNKQLFHLFGIQRFWGKMFWCSIVKYQQQPQSCCRCPIQSFSDNNNCLFRSSLFKNRLAGCSENVFINILRFTLGHRILQLFLSFFKVLWGGCFFLS